MHMIQLTEHQSSVTIVVIVFAFVIAHLVVRYDTLMLKEKCNRLAASEKALLTAQGRLIEENKDLRTRFPSPLPTLRRCTVTFMDPALKPLVIEASDTKVQNGFHLFLNSSLGTRVGSVRTETILSVIEEDIDPSVNLRTKIEERIAELRQASPSGVKMVDESHPYVLAELTRLLESLEK